MPTQPTMHMAPPSFALSYPSPSSLASSDTSYQLSDEDPYQVNMGTNNNEVHIDGLGVLNYQRAVDIARNTDGTLDRQVAAYLEAAINTIWTRITQPPFTYVMTDDEFAVFNLHRARYQNVPEAEAAVRRYWDNRSAS